MLYRGLADITLGVHFGFILFIVFGGLLALRWRWAMIAHLPAVLWGVLITTIGWTCPLTPIENHFRRLGGQAGYSGSFIEQYLVAFIYPSGLDRAGFVALGLLALVINLTIYGWVYRTSQRRVAGACKCKEGDLGD
jgi:hypothetical protein